MMVQERIEALRRAMQEHGVTVYVVPSDDDHGSEYVCSHYRVREYMTGFTGSAGTAVVTLEEAGLWTDGRYFLQAKRQLQGSGIRLFCMDEPGVPSLEEYIRGHLEEGGKLGFDGRVMSAFQAEKLIKTVEERKAGLLVTEDLAGGIWKERPELPRGEAFLLKEQWSGEGTDSKQERVRRQMRKEGADIHLLSSLCDIAWLLNIRGDDIPNVPVVLSFLILTEDACTWYVRSGAVPDAVRAYLSEHGVGLKEYEEIYADLGCLPEGQRLLLDKRNVNYRLLSSLPEGVTVLDRPNPSELMKAVKNGTEIQNLQEAHLKESIAFTRFMYWLKTHVGRERITECSAAEKLDRLRREQGHCLGQSFPPISAYGPHGAIVHYSPTKESDRIIEPKGFLLVDAGGHYLEGTTDTTRTIAVGPLCEEEKRMFTAVCRGNLNLASARFQKGCTGFQLDVLCREPLWQMGVDFKHGTGHGVGYLLNVHEGPNVFRWRQRREEAAVPLEPGMVTTDEPGVYIEGSFGIRTENELLCMEAEKNPYGTFLGFEILTLVPIDLDAILPSQMADAERKLLNDYHQKVYEALACHLPEEERRWLKKYTRKI